MICLLTVRIIPQYALHISQGYHKLMLILKHPDKKTKSTIDRTGVSGIWIQTTAKHYYWLILLQLLSEPDVTSSCVAGPGQTSSLDWGCELHSGVP